MVLADYFGVTTDYLLGRSEDGGQWAIEPRRRKKNRLKDHDYGCPGYYFLTACIRNKAGLLGEIAAEINISRGDSAHYECFEAVF